MPMEILIVDDSAVMRKMIRKVLGMTGIPLGAIHEAGNGIEGLEALARHAVDLAFVDINMPAMNGAQMIERMHADAKLAGIPIVVISTEVSDGRIGQLAKKGVRFIRKPFSPEKIRDTMITLTGTRP